jgi:hypothetical protein
MDTDPAAHPDRHPCIHSIYYFYRISDVSQSRRCQPLGSHLDHMVDPAFDPRKPDPAYRSGRHDLSFNTTNEFDPTLFLSGSTDRLPRRRSCQEVRINVQETRPGPSRAHKTSTDLHRKLQENELSLERTRNRYYPLRANQELKGNLSICRIEAEYFSTGH